MAWKDNKPPKKKIVESGLVVTKEIKEDLRKLADKHGITFEKVYDLYINKFKDFDTVKFFLEEVRASAVKVN